MIQSKYDAISDRIDAGAATNDDAKALLAENDDYMDKLTDCWLLLDAVARSGNLHNTDAEALLRKQQTPGWKGPPT